MEFMVVESKKTKLVFDLKGATHTICNALKDELWHDKDVVVSAYNIDHPLTGMPRFIVETDKDDPKKAVSGAITRLKKKNKDFLAKFSKSM